MNLETLALFNLLLKKNLISKEEYLIELKILRKQAWIKRYQTYEGERIINESKNTSKNK